MEETIQTSSNMTELLQSVRAVWNYRRLVQVQCITDLLIWDWCHWQTASRGRCLCTPPPQTSHWCHRRALDFLRALPHMQTYSVEGREVMSDHSMSGVPNFVGANIQISDLIAQQEQNSIMWDEFDVLFKASKRTFRRRNDFSIACPVKVGPIFFPLQGYCCLRSIIKTPMYTYIQFNSSLTQSLSIPAQSNSVSYHRYH